MFTNYMISLDIVIHTCGVAKLADFGTAKIIKSHDSLDLNVPESSIDAARAREPLLKQHSFKGTPRYMSPEMVKSDIGDREGAGDIWALGCVVRELATGEKPWGNLDNEWSVWELFSVG